MLIFYKRAFFVFLSMVLISAALAYLGITFTFLQRPLLPAENSHWPWQPIINSDAHQRGQSTIALDDTEVSLGFSFTLTEHAEYPFAGAALAFTKNEKPHDLGLADLSHYNTLSFSVKCIPSNTLTFTLLTVDDEITQLDNLLSYRAPATFFSCTDKWSKVELNLMRLETPQWWFDMFKLKLSHQHYSLKQVNRLVFGSSFQSPKNTLSSVQIHNLKIGGRDWGALYLAVIIIALIWISGSIVFFRRYSQALTQSLKDKMQKDLPLVAYQQLSVEPQHDKEKAAILRFMATEYANLELNLDTMVKSLGISRTKINDILKAELGYTFVSYLNKLRLTEAARLLTTKDDANVAEIAYSVGYKNVSYFNKLFKEEYDCTPKTFKTLCHHSGSPPEKEPNNLVEDAPK